MRRKCYLPKSYEELKELSPKELRFYWNVFYTSPLRGVKAKLRPLWYAIQCELGRCKLQEKYITRLDRYANNPDKYIEQAHKKRYALATGTILTKTYKGRTYQVAVKGESAYEWEGKIYPNLTALWSAPACKRFWKKYASATCRWLLSIKWTVFRALYLISIK